MIKEDNVKEINLEYFLIEKFYQFFLIVSAVMISELIVRTVTGFPEGVEPASMKIARYLRLQPHNLVEIQQCLIGYIVLVLGFTMFGLWCLRRGKQIGYISVGVLYMFLFVQLREVFVRSDNWAPSWDWMVWNLNKGLIMGIL